MWGTVGRILVVFATWGALLSVALTLGAPARAAEIAAAIGAGLTLVAWGLALRSARRADERMHPPVAEQRSRLA